MNPGQHVKTFTSKSGKEVIFRYPKKEDLDEFLSYINELSAEDTYIRYSGEVILRDQEEKFLTGALRHITLGNTVMTCAFLGGRLVGLSGIERNYVHMKRSQHIGSFGISLRKDFRGDGIGRELLRESILHAKENLNIRMIILTVFSNNELAQKLYKSEGFETYGVLPEGVLYKGAYVDLIEMYKKI